MNLGPELPAGTTAQHIASEAGVSRRTVYHLIQQGVLPPPGGSRTRPIWHECHVQLLRDWVEAKDQAKGAEWFRQIVRNMMEGS